MKHFNALKNIKVKNCKYITLPQIKDGIDGCLTIAEQNINIPFNIKRVYYIHSLENKKAIRGKHAHKELEQVLFCINGSFKMCLDDGSIKQEIKLNKPNIGLFLGINLWHTMTDFSDDCVLLVFASDLYKEKDYVRNYDEFKKNSTKK